LTNFKLFGGASNVLEVLLALLPVFVFALVFTLSFVLMFELRPGPPSCFVSLLLKYMKYKAAVTPATRSKSTTTPPRINGIRFGLPTGCVVCPSGANCPTLPEGAVGDGVLGATDGAGGQEGEGCCDAGVCAACGGAKPVVACGRGSSDVGEEFDIVPVGRISPVVGDCGGGGDACAGGGATIVFICCCAGGGGVCCAGGGAATVRLGGGCGCCGGVEVAGTFDGDAEGTAIVLFNCGDGGGGGGAAIVLFNSAAVLSRVSPRSDESVRIVAPRSKFVGASLSGGS
jgi:hypothetical protein